MGYNLYLQYVTVCSSPLADLYIYILKFPVVNLRVGVSGNPPTGQNVLNFMQFLANFSKSVCWCPLGGSMSPPMGNTGSTPDVSDERDKN